MKYYISLLVNTFKNENKKKMDYKIENEKVKDFFVVVDDLENLLTDRISDLHEVRGGMQARHAYILYRKLLWEAKYLMRENLKEIKPKSK